MKFILQFFTSVSVVILSLTCAFSQQLPARKDTVAKKTDSLVQTVRTDTIPKKSASSGLNSEVKYSAEDSIRTDIKNNIVYLYGKARVSYEDFELDADYIRLDQKQNIVFAKGSADPKSAKYRGKPIFIQGSEPPVTTDSLTFNFKTKKAKIYGIYSDVEGGYLQARQSKKNEFDEISIKNGIYSTCNLPEPHTHFGIYITRGIVTEKQIVTGPAYLVIEHVPMPLAVPFGFFPKPNKRASGIMLPTFGEDFQKGFYMQGLGYYFGINDYIDGEVRGTLFSKGSYNVDLTTRYKKNYKYDGNLMLSYGSTKSGIEGTESNKPRRDFKILWSHTQDVKANPGTTFSAQVDAGTASYNANMGVAGGQDYARIIQNNANSSISYTKSLFDGLFSLSSALRASQNFTNKTVDLTLPDVSLTMSSINPFDSKDRVGEQKWYQKVNVGYSLRGSNSISTTEDKLFDRDGLKRFKNGLEHSIPVSLSLNALKYFQVSTSVQYNEKWYLQTIRKSLDNTQSGFEERKDTLTGFSRSYEYNLSTGLSTKLYGQANFKKGNLVALRHVITPSVFFSYHPDFGESKYGYYKSFVGKNNVLQRYSIYEDNIYGSPSYGKTASIGFSVDNNIEAKVRSKSDSTNKFEKIPIIQGLSFSGNYNFVADSLKLSQISFSGRTAFFKQKLGVNFNGTFDPYKVDTLGNRVNRFAFRDGVLARLVNFGLSFDFSLNSQTIINRNKALRSTAEDLQNKDPQQAQELERLIRDPNAYVDFNVPWNISASYYFNYNKTGIASSLTSTLNFSGDLSLTPKWKVTYNSGYDFVSRAFTFPQLSIYRDLHCWDLSFSWIPFGTYKSYNVNLRVRASVLQDLKLTKNRGYSSFY